MALAGPQKSGAEEARRQKLRPERWLRYFLPMADGWSERHQDLLTGGYDGVDRIVLNGYFRPGHRAGGFRVGWQNLTGSAETLDNTQLMRWAGRFSRRIRGWAKANRVPRIDGRSGPAKAPSGGRTSQDHPDQARTISDPGEESASSGMGK